MSRRVRMTALGESFISSGKDSSRKKNRGHFQDRPAGGASVLQWRNQCYKGRALLWECSKETENPNLLSCREGSRCSQAISASAFLIAGPGGFGVCTIKGYLTEETFGAASSHIAVLPSLNSLKS